MRNSSPLFKSRRHHRINPRGTPGREESRSRAENQKNQQRRTNLSHIVGLNPIKLAGNQPRGGERDGKTSGSAECDNQQRFAQNHPRDFSAPPGAQSHADTDFVCPPRRGSSAKRTRLLRMKPRS